MTVFGKKSDNFCHLYPKTVKRFWGEQWIIYNNMNGLWRNRDFGTVIE